MKRILIFLLLLTGAININAQEILLPKNLKTIPNSKSYWAYSVERSNNTSLITSHGNLPVIQE